MIKFTAYNLRHRPTISELKMWEVLRSRRMVGLKFRRQHPIGPFIVDFICLSKRLIIEVDGPIHKSREQYDYNRDQWIKSQGYSILRISNDDLNFNYDGTVERIRKYSLKLLGF